MPYLSMPFRIASALTLAAAIAAPASAAPSSEDRVPGGLRLELLAGYDVLSAPDRLEGTDDIVPDRVGGVRVGVAAGYDVAVTPRLAVGGEIGIGANASGGVDARLARDTLRIEAGRDLDVAVRVGFALAPGTIVFGKVGYAHSRLRARLSEWEGTGYSVGTRTAGSGGVRLGVGMERRVSGRVHAKGEYRWTSYGSDIGYQTSPVRHQFLAGLGVRL